MTHDSRRHPKEIDAFGVDAVCQGDQHGNRKHIGAIEARRDPAGLTVRKLPEWHDAGHERWPEERADLHEHLRGADDRNQSTSRLRKGVSADGHRPAVLTFFALTDRSYFD